MSKSSALTARRLNTATQQVKKHERSLEGLAAHQQPCQNNGELAREGGPERPASGANGWEAPCPSRTFPRPRCQIPEKCLLPWWLGKWSVEAAARLHHETRGPARIRWLRGAREAAWQCYGRLLCFLSLLVHSAPSAGRQIGMHVWSHVLTLISPYGTNADMARWRLVYDFEKEHRICNERLRRSICSFFPPISLQSHLSNKRVGFLLRARRLKNASKASWIHLGRGPSRPFGPAREKAPPLFSEPCLQQQRQVSRHGRVLCRRRRRRRR